MNYTWFKIFNTAEFDDLDIPSRTYVLNLVGIGQKSILVTKGTGYGMTCDDVFLYLDLNGANPFEFDGFAIYKNSSNDVFLGIAVDEN